MHENEKKTMKNPTRLEVTNMKVNVAEMARRTGLSEKTISKRISENSTGKSKSSRRKRGSKIDPYKSIIEEKYEQYGSNASDIYHFLTNECGYDGSYDLVKNYLRDFKETSLRKATVRVETNPGLQGQVDWKESLKMYDKQGKAHTVNIFLYVLCYSRTRYIELTLSRSQDVLFECMLNAFEYTGGVPEEIWFDNQSAVVDSHDIQTGSVEFNRKFLEFAKAVSFKPIACRPFRPQTKGKVESLAKLMNRLRPYNKEFESLDELDGIVRKLNDEINSEVCQATGSAPFELLGEEQKHLMPVVPSQIREQYKATKKYKVSKESVITYMGSKYSVPVEYISKRVSAEAADDVLRIYYNAKLIATHPLIKGKTYNYRKEDLIEILGSDALRNREPEEIEKKASELLKKYDEVK